MKKLFLFLVILVAITELQAQKLPALDKSPADVAWLPPKRKDPVAKIIYSRPQKGGRTMLGGTEPFGKVWRLGANESTEIVVIKKATFGDKTIEPGTYTMYAIPEKDKWTIIFNKKLNTWGAYEYDQTQDVARIDVPVGKTESEVEAFTIAFEEPAGNASNMLIAWENTLVKVPVKF
ncbi:MAG TPA: DUF2911 domain-containing protein [Cyclobacteriaceae bacterium]